MSFDVRLPIGLLFLTLGLILAVYGLRSDPAIYARHSMGVNINLVWGAVMAVFGLVMLVLTRLGRKAQAQPDR
jgi:hypothetical protein